MKPSARILRSDFERKPPHGSPCNRCGVCCMATKCAIGEHLFGGKLGRCPALVPDANGYSCGVVADPTQYSIRTAIYGVDKMREAALTILYAGEGCDARFNGEWINEKFHRECEERDLINLPKRQAALKLWGIE